jgi:autoinducer 2 (AI-2) kinase
MAVAVTSQRQGIALLDGAGETLYAGPNIDLRGIFQGTRLLLEHGERIYAITGHLPPYLFAPARLLWFRDHQPKLYARVRSLLMLDGWLTWKLSGTKVAEVASAAESGLFDISRRTWSADLIAALDLPADIYPPVLPAGAIAGHLTDDAAALTGLEAGIPIVTAGPDTQCGLLGMGAVAAGEMGIVAGWSSPAQQVVHAPTFDPQRNLWTTCHLLPDTWVVEANAGPAGQAHRWLRDILVPDQGFATLDELATQAATDADEGHDLPLLAFLGPRLADYGTPTLLWGGLIFPLIGGYDGFENVRRTHLARAGLENISFALRANLERMEGLIGPRTGPVRLGGGLTRSHVFPQILTDVLGVPVWVADLPAVTSLGAALCAAVGIGLCSDLPEAVARMRPTGRTLEPQRVTQAHYLDAYERWRHVYDQLGRLGTEMS